ncbi:MAG: AAA family ATPase [Dehalococcoidia bacterium]|nr:AAA family ATPase [Dehalococcoidia bacterium]
MSIQNQILKWAKRLPDWQSDAVRRIFVKGDLTESDQTELLAMLKKTKGIEDPDDAAPSPIILQASDLPSPSDSKSIVILKSMHGMKNVNALAPDQTLKFALKGVTVVYGCNASGKSGYSRVLKKACRARGQDKDVLPNVFAPYNPDAVAEALFDISIDGQDRTERWVDKQPAPDSLASIAVFDTEAARFYMDEDNDVVYIPYGLDVFDKLGHLCTNLKARLEKELLSPLVELPKDLTDLEPRTSVGRLIRSLTYETDVAEVENLAKLTHDELERLEKLRVLMVQIDVNRPEVRAAQCRRFKSRIEKLRNEITALDNGLSAEKCNNLKLLQTKFREATEAARLASEKAFKNQPLKGVGSGPWREMFEAARRYSELLAYPDHSFPYTAEESRCVLCQQPLGEEAKRRMQSFEEFIKQDTAREAEIAEKALKLGWDNFCGLQLQPELAGPTIVEEIGEVDSDCKGVLLQYLKSVNALAASIRQSYEKHEWGEITPLSPTPVLHLNALIEATEISAKEWDATAQPKDQQELRDEFEELNARKVLSARKPLVLNHISRQIYRHQIQECIEGTNTLEISLQKRKIMNQAVTQVLKNNLDSELRSLGAGHIRLDLVQKVRAGTTLHCLKLQSTAYGNLNVSDVLSEGEQRAVAIASLLAEVRRASHFSGLVFDDPVSSLDHIWRHKVAERLVREGNDRQIIIFTHDIAFLCCIQKECDEQGVPIHKAAMQLGSEGYGVCNPPYAVPWEAMKVQERVQHLYLRCKEVEKEYKARQIDRYRDLSRDCYDLLRQCWERAVEEVLFNKVVERFDPEVNTKSLIEVSVTDDDYVKIDYAMAKCSEVMHDAAAAANKPMPPPEELRQDIESLSAFVQEIRTRRKAIKNGREKQLKAPAPEIC